MGIVNVTPDSFSDGGKYFHCDKAIARGLELRKQGADIIDVGGESTRPGALPLSQDEELRRVLPVIEELSRQDVPVSIDTYKSPVAEAALNAGAVMVNDISGLRFDPDLAQITAKYKAKMVLMHIRGTPRDMQVNPYYDNLICEILEYLNYSIDIAISAGIPKENIIIDPGIGFGKRFEDNLEILRRLREFRGLECPLMIGVSRKSFIGRILDLPPEKRLFGTCGACALAVANGADILRVHDVKEIKETIAVVDAICGKQITNKVEPAKN
jgi:dihydropteroate synthase